MHLQKLPENTNYPKLNVGQHVTKQASVAEATLVKSLIYSNSFFYICISAQDVPLSCQRLKPFSRLLTVENTI